MKLTPVITLAALVLTMLALAYGQSTQTPGYVAFYEHHDFHGRVEEVWMEPGVCVDFGDQYHLEHQISSINVLGKCVVMFRNRDCTGPWIRFRPGQVGHDKFRRIGHNDNLNSARLC